jgi:DNA-binding NtrC family response regulator
VFEIQLPEASVGCTPDDDGSSAAASPSDSEFEESFRVTGWRVAVIEDDPVVAKSIEISLQTLGVSVEVFFSAESALEKPDILEADFYISDFNLPGIDGVQLLSLLQRRSSDPIDAILMTGEASKDQIEFTSASRWPVLFKPVGLNKLLALMNEAAKRRQLV